MSYAVASFGEDDDVSSWMVPTPPADAEPEVEAITLPPMVVTAPRTTSKTAASVPKPTAAPSAFAKLASIFTGPAPWILGGLGLGVLVLSLVSKRSAPRSRARANQRRARTAKVKRVMWGGKPHWHVLIISNRRGVKHADFGKDEIGARQYATDWNAMFGTRTAAGRAPRAA